MQLDVARSRRAAAIVAAAALALGACGSDDAGDGVTTSAVPPATVVVSTAAPVPEQATTSAPRRIVSLSASLTEMLFAVGAGDQVIAVDRYSNHPPGTPMTDLSGFKPNVEAIAELDPDLVVLAADRDGIVAALDAIGVPSLVLSSAASVDDALAQLGAIGRATGHEAAAIEVVTGLRAAIEVQTARVPEREAPLTYYVELGDDGHSATSATFLGNVLTLAGLTSIADASPADSGAYPQLSAEAVLEADPDVILLAHGDGANPTSDELAARPGWSALQAVTGGHVVALDPDTASRWGPRLVELLTGVVDATATIT